MKQCIFCQIINKEAPADIVYEDNSVIVFKDINPSAPIHLLIVPKKHIISINNLKKQDKELVGYMFLVAKKIAKEQGVSEIGYRLIINVGKGGGQIIDHLHLHLLGGRELPFS
ncbi:MAG: histidine triad nucleotide-binding protein [Candidatus Pacebacteria bacterium]|nr:histidine triad nucleotide-binding protein [Candidatus Paceibacterota bacterium]